MGKFLNIEKITIPEIPKEVRAPSELRIAPSVGGGIGSPEGPHPFGDNYRGDEVPTMEMKIIPDLKNNAGLQYTDLGAARTGEIYRQSPEFTPFVIEGRSLLFGDRRPTVVSDPSLEAINRELENYVSLVPELLGEPSRLAISPSFSFPSKVLRLLFRALKFIGKGFEDAFKYPPFFFGGPMIIFMSLLGKGKGENGAEIIPIDSIQLKGGRVLPVYGYDDYIGEKDRLHEVVETTHASLEGYVRKDDFQFYVNEILTRGDLFRIDATATANPEAIIFRAQDLPESPEKVKAFFVSAGFDGDQVVRFTITTGDRKTVREIYQAFFEKYEETGSAIKAYEWLLESPWSFWVR